MFGRKQYLPIKIKEQHQDDEELSIEVQGQEDSSNDGDDDSSVENVSLEDAVPSTKESLVEDRDVQLQQQDKKVSRAEKRIRQLSSEKSDLLRRIEEYESKLKDTEEKFISKAKESSTAIKERLEDKYNLLSSQMVSAMESGDSATVVKLQEQMMDTRMQLAGISADIANQQNQYNNKVEPATTKKPSSSVPEKAMEWIEDHPQFKSDEVFYATSLAVSRVLVNEGFDDSSDEFYKELDTRLAPKFPEIFGIKEEKVVEYTESQIEQRVSGASRTPSINKKTGSSVKRGKNTVLLSPEDVREAGKLGLSLEQMARRMAHAETATSASNGYTEILMKQQR